MIHYTVNIDTANVRNPAAAVTFDGIAVGSIVERPAVRAAAGRLSAYLAPVTG
jgi:predicted aspartyl protease